jgi:hypothetical protein
MPYAASRFAFAALAFAAVAAPTLASAAPNCTRPPCANIPRERIPGERVLEPRTDASPPALNFGVEFTGPYVGPRLGPFTHNARRSETVRLIATAHDGESRVRSVQIRTQTFMTCRNLRDRTMREFSRTETVRDVRGDAYAIRAYARVLYIADFRAGLICPAGWEGMFESQRFVMHAVATNGAGVRATTLPLTIRFR